MTASRDTREGRPDPDRLLAQTRAEARGRLTIFLGAAPGVGKTYAMLSRARKLKEDGVDIVIGLVETHGRQETAALVDGLEVLPRATFAHRGHDLAAFDLDGALARKPRVIVVDELASSNPEGARHPKRFQDIEELIEAGIEVWTAMNIQHLESLSDVVTDITGVRVRERVPDIVLQEADEVLLVDIPPVELIERLKAGKVYLPDSANRAAERFFRAGNLTALRELALRRTADHVDDDMVDYLKRHAIEGAWASAERLIVCVGDDALSDKVVRTASRLASGLNAPWIVVSLERADREPADADAPARVDALFKLAEGLGAETRRLVATDFVAELLRLARREHATQIVLGAQPPGRWPFRRPSLAQALASQAEGLSLHLVTGSETDQVPRSRRRAQPRRRDALLSGLTAVVSAGAATLLAVGIEQMIRLPNVSLLFLMAVVVSAIRAGYLAAFATAVLSGLAYNFFFIPPLYTFTIASPHEVFAFCIFLGAALLVGGLASRVREQAEAARLRARTVQSLYDFAGKLAGTVKADDVLWAAASQLHETLGRPVALFVPRDGELALALTWPPDAEPDVTDRAAARWAFEHREASGHGTGTLPASAYRFRPMESPHGVVGVCGLRWEGLAPDSLSERMLDAVLDQAAVALDRARLADESIAQAAKLQGDNLRAALLSSISHDLRTPLSTITGAVTSLRQLGERMRPESRDDLLLTIEEESARLSRFVANLLDMTRIEAGTLEARHDWIDIGDVVRAAAERSARYFPELTVETSIAQDLPLIRADSVLLGQVLFNLLDNAGKYAPGEPVKIYVRKEGDSLMISVTDGGRGIPQKDLETIFDKFFRRGKPDGRAPGTGLGLSIARGFVEAMGGRITAESPAHKRRGTRMTLRFPLTAQDKPPGLPA
ncbi:histidine kinase [Xaviernesmea oryzae]|uniref:histidine kinase n=1 Tax=Xaviernesmea oryzae TaxID=464029 RepID=A0A1Q9B1J4_9HYPH|nr:sensor histidine kinase KdpD [Xaviernesmea oryzae]OLP61877.1 histidine kinase [Xaviernesmea oryzae]SEL74629.1 two-component system, OmpR family, sensor histidine kinase KdpD [Xaviernesmea oryzae]